MSTLIQGVQQGAMAQPDTRDWVRADRLQLLYWQSFPAVFLSVAVATLLALLV